MGKRGPLRVSSLFLLQGLPRQESEAGRRAPAPACGPVPLPPPAGPSRKPSPPLEKGKLSQASPLPPDRRLGLSGLNGSTAASGKLKELHKVLGRQPGEVRTSLWAFPVLWPIVLWLTRHPPLAVSWAAVSPVPLFESPLKDHCLTLNCIDGETEAQRGKQLVKVYTAHGWPNGQGNSIQRLRWVMDSQVTPASGMQPLLLSSPTSPKLPHGE